MLNVSKVVTVAVQWTTVVTIVCALFVWLFPGLTAQLTPILFHAVSGTAEVPMLTVGSVLLYIIFWDILAALGAWLLATLWNRTKA